MSKLNKTQIVICGVPIWLETEDQQAAEFAEERLTRVIKEADQLFNPKPTTPALSIPPGWRELEEGNLPTTSDYWYAEGIHSWCQSLGGERQTNCAYITQLIDIDLDKQPEEFVAWARDSVNTDYPWSAYKGIPIWEGSKWTMIGSVYNDRELVESEHPTHCECDVDSLLVRPEYFNTQDDSRGEE